MKNRNFATFLLFGTVIFSFSSCLANCEPIKEIGCNKTREYSNVGRYDLFEAITGVDEYNFRKNEEIIRKCIQKGDDGNFYIVNIKTGEKTCAGKFEEISIGEMDEELSKIKNYPGGGTFNVISLGKKYSDASEELRKKVDISSLQAKEENKEKVFVVSSNFNALETLGSYDSVSSKTISSYIGDNTQGPYAAMSAMAGLILRTYGIFYDGNKNPKDWRQTDENQVELLRDLNIKTQNGYVIEDENQIYEKLTSKNARKNFKIGYHKDIQVSGGYFKDIFNQEFIKDKTQKIDQIYLAALNVYDFDINSEKAKKAAKKLLSFNYEATLKSAFLNGKKEVVIPLMGCNVFGNKPEWHVEAVKENLDFIKKSGIKVTLNLVDKPAQSVFKKVCKDFKNLALQSVGEYTLFS